MKRALFLALILAVFLSARGQKTEIQYLSGLNKDHMVQWEFFCNNGMNSGKWSKIGVLRTGNYRVLVPIYMAR